MDVASVECWKEEQISSPGFGALTVLRYCRWYCSWGECQPECEKVDFVETLILWEGILYGSSKAYCAFPETPTHGG